MIPLRPFAAVLVVGAVWFLLLAVLARRATRETSHDDRLAVRLRRLRWRGYLAGWLCCWLAIRVTGGVPQWPRSPVVPRAGGLTALLAGLVVVTVVVAVRLAVHPYRAQARGLPTARRPEGYFLLTRATGGLLVFVAAVTVVGTVPPGLARVAATGLLGVVVAALAPVVILVGLRDWRPTPEERALLEPVPDDVRVLVVNDRNRVGVAFAAGVVPGVRYVFVSESLFSVLSSDQLSAVLAHEVAHHRRNHVALRFALGIGPGLAWLAALDYGVPYAFPAGLALAVPFALAVAAVNRHTEYEADRDAGVATDPLDLADALRTLRRHGLVISMAGAASALAFHPGIEERIERLEAMPGTVERRCGTAVRDAPQ